MSAPDSKRVIVKAIGAGAVVRRTLECDIWVTPQIRSV